MPKESKKKKLFYGM